jgi:fructose-1,6-bisphosphatase/inositol monophosphatase family enzyme
MHTTREIERALDVVRVVIASTRLVIQRYAREGFTSEQKSDATLVTEADREAERVAREVIERHFPSHGIVGEEFPRTNPESEFTWYLDPIDGTQNYFHGIPTYGTIVGLYHGDTPVAVGLDHPGINRTYLAARGRGAFCNGTRLAIRNGPAGVIEPHEIIALSSRQNFMKYGRPEVFDTLTSLHPHLRIYYDCSSHGFAAEGSLGAVIEANLKFWDIAAAPLLMAEAGGRMEFLSIRERKDGNHVYDVIFGKPSVVDYLLPRVREAFARIPDPGEAQV